jgi:hypothetical protein
LQFNGLKAKKSLCLAAAIALASHVPLLAIDRLIENLPLEFDEWAPPSYYVALSCIEAISLGLLVGSVFNAIPRFDGYGKDIDDFVIFNSVLVQQAAGITGVCIMDISCPKNSLCLRMISVCSIIAILVLGAVMHDSCRYHETYAIPDFRKIPALFRWRGPIQRPQIDSKQNFLWLFFNFTLLVVLQSLCEGRLALAVKIARGKKDYGSSVNVGPMLGFAVGQLLVHGVAPERDSIKAMRYTTCF